MGRSRSSDQAKRIIRSRYVQPLSTGAWNVTIDWTAQTSAAVDSGTLDPDTLYVTGDADRFASWQAQYGDKADYITWDIAAAGIYDRRDEYYFMAPKQ